MSLPDRAPVSVRCHCSARMKYIDTWLSGLGLQYIIPKLKDNGIVTPKQLASLTLRDIYEVVGVEDSEDRKKLYFLVQRLQSILQSKPASTGDPAPTVSSDSPVAQDNVAYHEEEEDIRKLRKNRRSSMEPQIEQVSISTVSKPEKEIVKIEPKFEAPSVIASSSVSQGILEDMPIRVVVRKRPLSKSELAKGDRDILEIRQNGVVLVHEPKVKVDLTRVVETQTFIFDDAFDDNESNDVIYRRTVRPLIDFIFSGGKATCFAYGQTGSGKTFSMMGCGPDDSTTIGSNSGLYLLAACDIFKKLQNQPHLKVYVSCFEIYGTKLFDLLNMRAPIKCLEDSKQRVQTPGLTEHPATRVADLLELMRTAHNQRSVGSTGANSESSRSHQILHIILKDKSKKKDDVDRKLSFIDLAGSERGADTVHSSKQTRQEGAEINTSLLALKEVIRSLEKKSGHTPFRGSKLTQVLKDSFVGARTRTCMLACISPSQSSCENTLNTLRYADRVKENQGGASDQVSTGPTVDPIDDCVVLSEPISERPPLTSAVSVSRMEAGPVTLPKTPITESKRRSVSQPAGTLSKRNRDIPVADEPASKVLGRPLSEHGPAVHRVTEKLKDRQDVNSASKSRDGILSSTGMLQKILDLLSAHKLSIAEMVEVMKDEMELVQEMENVDKRDSVGYIAKLSDVLEAKQRAIMALQDELNSFTAYRNKYN